MLPLLLVRWRKYQLTHGTFFGAPHSDLGRSGPVCPFVPESLKQNSFYIAVAGGVCSREAIKACVLSARTVFGNLAPKDARNTIFKSLIIAFPDVNPGQYEDAIDGVQAELKSDFVRQGLMVGQFHPNQKETGLHSASFHPFRAPLPMLAIRHMHPADIVFLYSSDFNRDCYLLHFGAEGADRLLSFMAQNPEKFDEEARPRITHLCHALKYGTGREMRPRPEVPASAGGCPFKHLHP